MFLPQVPKSVTPMPLEDGSMKTPGNLHRPRRGFTLIELLVVIAIIAVLMGLLIPAVQKVREAANRMKCGNNLKQQGIALHNYADTFNILPSGGEGTNWAVAPAGPSQFDLQSTFTLMLPYIEQGNVFNMMNMAYAYNDPRWPGNQVAAQTAIAIYVCPSNPWRQSAVDSMGYGCTDYGPTCYTDIDPVTGLRNKPTRADGALALHGTRFADIQDGTAYTIAIAEDVGRNETYVSAYIDPVTGGLRSFWRWAEPDCAYGVSGDPTGMTLQAINHNPLPWGGSAATCLWAPKNNCGNNDEIFSFHPGGANALFCDGHVDFLKETIDPRIVRMLVTRIGGEDIPDY
jgi:prepilin-type N-terminal cleavage/methylation domain-containing protein/prepilin-type processing-associated H-X9-DG protein